MSYPEGSVITIRGAFANRALTTTELAAFLAGQGLPQAVGTTPATVTFFYRKPDGAEATLTGGQLTVDGVGAYHVELPVTIPGSWTYWWAGVDGGGNPVAATSDHGFMVTARTSA